MSDHQVKINPALIAALEHFGKTRFLPSAETAAYFVHTAQDGKRTQWSIEEACGRAAEVLEDEDLMVLKFKALTEGLKKFGLDDAYERIMGEKLP